MIKPFYINYSLKRDLEQMPEEKRVKINYPMTEFKKNIRLILKLPQIVKLSWLFTDDDIEKQNTTAILKTEHRSFRLCYHHQTNKVDCMFVGNDLDPVRKTIDVSECYEEIKTFCPAKKVLLKRVKRV